MEEAGQDVLNQIREAYRRYKGGLYPITERSILGLQLTELLISKWGVELTGSRLPVENILTRIGFFDGGSRGNPGPGGSGSVIVEVDGKGLTSTLIWAALTALGRASTTNNVVEFVGLHRLLQYAAERQWRGLHVIGDSELILRMMRERKAPKATKLQHWYRQTRRLSGQVDVGSWTHHYSAHNKMVDWLANQAMDSKRSIMTVFTDGDDRHLVYKGLLRLMYGYVRQWTSSNKGLKSELR